MPGVLVPIVISWTEMRDDEGGAYWDGDHPWGRFRIWDAGFSRAAYAVQGTGFTGYGPPVFSSLHAAQKTCWESLKAALDQKTVGL